jgi:hypothetical protein
MTTPTTPRIFWALAVATTIVIGTVSPAQAAAPSACDLLTDAEVSKLIARGQTTYSAAPDATTLAGGAGSVCQYEHGQTGLWMGPGSEARFEQFLASWEQDKQPRHAVSGVGDTAYVIYPKPRNSYSDEGPFVVATVGANIVTASLFARKGQASGVMGEVCRGDQAQLNDNEKKECAKVLADSGETPESLQPAAVELAKVLVAKLRAGTFGQ